MSKAKPRGAAKGKAHVPALRKKTFLAEYRQVGNITAAADAVGIGRRTHYDWMEQDEAYRLEFEDATDEAADRLEFEARRRAVTGVDEPVGWYQGSPGGMVKKYSDTLLIFLLKGARPAKYRDGYEQVSETAEELARRAKALLAAMEEADGTREAA